MPLFMRSSIIKIICILLLAYGCKSDEEVLPVPPPATEETETETPPTISEDDKERPVDEDSDFFLYRKFENMPYRILYPKRYDSTRHYALHIFLHGMGERGTDNEKHLSIGASYFMADSIREKYPSFVIYPQCPLSNVWFDNDMTSKVKRMLDSLQQHVRLDSQRISIGGFSMGAYGTFEMVSRYPGYFEAALAISGDGDPERASALAKTRWQIFAGERDDVVPSARTQRIAEAIKAAGASVYFTLYQNADHGGTWVHAFSEPALFSRLFIKPKQDPVLTGE
jgi:predicted peptidase